jgi:hypothetical protein
VTEASKAKVTVFFVPRVGDLTTMHMFIFHGIDTFTYPAYTDCEGFGGPLTFHNVRR